MIVPKTCTLSFFSHLKDMFETHVSVWSRFSRTPTRFVDWRDAYRKQNVLNKYRFTNQAFYPYIQKF